MHRFRGKVFTPSDSETLAQSHLLLSGDPVSRGPGCGRCFGPARGCCGRDDNRLESRLRKGQQEVAGASRVGGTERRHSPPELEGISRPRTVMSCQGRSGQQPLAWSCPFSA